MRITLLSLLLFFSTIVYCQDNPNQPNVFLDCQTNCYQNYIKQEIKFIDYQRERQGADIYVLVTSQSASAGARQIQMIFSYDSIKELRPDTIVYYREANISNLEEQELFKNNLKRGLLPALALSSLSDAISYEVATSDVLIIGDTVDIDPWNYWSYELGLNVNVDGESTFNEQEYFGRVSASRVTNKDKINFNSWYNFSQAEFTLSDGEKVKSENRGYRFFTQYVKSVSDHWSVGARMLMGSSTFGNTDFEATFRPAIEYNIYPYSANSTRRFTWLYSTGIVYKNYTELTVFDRLEESLWRHSIDVEFEQTQKWGTLSFDVNFDQYFRDLSLLSLSFNPNVELNLVRGLRLQFGGLIAFVGDRINIAKGELSDQDIILQNRQLDTNFSYSTYVGFNFRFGSKNNNIVNPRF